MDEGGAVPDFNFKWADNTCIDGSTEDSGDILDFYQYGDVAPGGRFMFSFSATSEMQNTQNPKNTQNPTDVVDDNNSSFSIPWYFYMVGGVILISVIAVIVYIKKLNKN